MYSGDADMGVDAELVDNNTSYNYDFNISNLTRWNLLDKGYGPKKSVNNSITFGDKELKIKGKKLKFFGGMSCDLTLGLYSLIFRIKPANYNDYTRYS